MKLRTAILALTACGLSFPSLADMNIDLPDSAELILVNGVKAEGNDTLTLKNGQNQIAFRYDDGFRENGEYSLFRSDVVIMTFTGIDTHYSLTLPKLRSSLEGREFNRKPALTLTDKSGTPVTFEQGKLMKNGMQLGRDFEAEIAAYNQTSQPAAVAAISLQATSQLATNINTNTANQAQGENVAENMLNYWYEQADEATRIRFKSRINQP
ncbi:YccT family protein [Photobacterium lipolyticum]|uniref:UPF0319 protein C9I89_16375 n=1 Tax=Photobacterium lipolyticum TaxID=266810 RepID=A0A2T3MUR8_9GAMM|nr:DUF2057 domain-containing protein [Photobacterium lipolyticum]PSW03709.1 DUF2057 domain-containing protein [Photobacterium lipolyticum]